MSSVLEKRERDHVLNDLRYRCHLSRYMAHSEDQKLKQMDAMVKARS